jgi:integrase
MKIDRAALARLKPGQTISADGIRAEMTADGDIRYLIAARLDGQRLHRVVGYASEGMTPRRARDALEKMRVAGREGRLALPKARKTHLSIAEAARAYLDRLEAGEGGAKNIARKRQQLEQHLLPYLGTQRLSTLERSTLERYRKHRRSQGASDSTCNREMACLSHLLSRAVEWKWIAALPCRVPKMREEGGRITVLDDEQQKALLDAAVADQNQYVYLFCAFAMNTGCRHSEILRARYDQVDYARQRIYIPEAKAGQREQVITAELAAMLKREQAMAEDPKGWIFPSQRPDLDRDGHMTRMDRPFRRVVERAGLDPALVTAHVLRHSAISTLIMSGADVASVQRISGHRTLAMVMKYVHLHSRHVDSVAAILGRSALPGVTRTSHDQPDAPPDASRETSQVIVFPKKK